MSTYSNSPDADPAHHLKIATQGAALATHADLWQWLQGEVQDWLAHDVLLVGWGDIRAGELQFDVVSSMPGVHTAAYTRPGIAPLIAYLRDCWVAARKLPCHLDLTGCSGLLHECPANMRAVMGSMQSALVHGFGKGNWGGERVFAALRTDAVAQASAGALKLLLPFIDTALRRKRPMPARQARCTHLATNLIRLADLSDRERQIMTWIAMSKTNPEIGCILHISDFTVKDHMQSIFSKLDVSNRAQAVASLTRMHVHA